MWAPYRGAAPLRTRTKQIPTQRRPTPPRHRISCTCTRASQRPRPPISTRRSTASKRTRARADRRWCPSAAQGRLRRRHRLGRFDRPPLAAAGRAALQHQLQHLKEASCAPGHAHPCAERAREHRSCGRRGVDSSVQSTDTGEGKSTGARRGNARTIAMCTVADLIRMRDLGQNRDVRGGSTQST